MSQQLQAGKMSAAPLAPQAPDSAAAGMLEGRQRKLESMIRDPRSPVNVESLLVRGGGGRRANKGGAAPRLGREEGREALRILQGRAKAPSRAGGGRSSRLRPAETPGRERPGRGLSPAPVVGPRGGERGLFGTGGETRLDARCVGEGSAPPASPLPRGFAPPERAERGRVIAGFVCAVPGAGARRETACGGSEGSACCRGNAGRGHASGRNVARGWILRGHVRFPLGQIDFVCLLFHVAFFCVCVCVCMKYNFLYQEIHALRKEWEGVLFPRFKHLNRGKAVRGNGYYYLN